MQEAGNYAVTQFKHTHSDLQTCGVTDVHTETSPEVTFAFTALDIYSRFNIAAAQQRLHHPQSSLFH